MAHLEATRQRLADGVLLARVLNRTVVLPQFQCLCDKYWGRLAQCTIPHLAHPLASQPLPFVCPVDHVIPISGWHGNWAARKARGRRCALPGRADGPPADGAADFALLADGATLHVLGVESPGLTASLALAEEAADAALGLPRR